MIYSVINVCVAPERHWEGIQQLKILARWLTEKYEAETTLLDSRSGDEDQKQLVTRYQNKEQMREIDRKLLQDAEFDAWLTTAKDLMSWDCIPGMVFQVMDW